MSTETKTCVICCRELGSETLLSKHHLIPKSKGGRHSPTILIHNICHQKIHSVFTEKELKNHYNTVEKLLANEAMSKFVKWVGKKHIDFYEVNRKMKR